METLGNKMRYVFRGHTVFDYDPTRPYEKVRQGRVHGDIPAFDHCVFIPEDFKLMSQFFDTVYRHINGEDVELKDIVVN
jgi:hypothetical protein